jgi:hypothetical protein
MKVLSDGTFLVFGLAFVFFTAGFAVDFFFIKLPLLFGGRCREI